MASKQPISFNTKNTRLACLYLAPAGISLLVFMGMPIIVSIILSLHNWSFLSPVKPFIGIDNYVEMFQSKEFWNAFWNTLIYTIGTVPVGMALAVFYAYLIMKSGKLMTFYRALFFAPAITSLVAVSIVWMWIFQPQCGLLNYILSLFNIPAQPWLSSPAQALLGVIIVSVWQGLGRNIVLFLAGMSNISKELYEAAAIDGVSGFALFRYITWPLLSPTTMFVGIISIIDSFKVFTQVQVMTTGGPVKATEVIVFKIWQEAFINFRMGYASALAIFLFAIIFVLTVIQFKLSEKRVHYQ